MPRDEESLQWSDLDFGWGIWSADEVVSGHAAAPDGAATRDTYGCWSPPAGGLAPLPGESTSVPVDIDNILDQTLNPTTANMASSSDFAHGMDRAWLGDGKIIGPTIPTSGANQTVPDAVLTAWTVGYQDPGAPFGWNVGHSTIARVVGFAERIVDNVSNTNEDYVRVGPTTIIQAIGYDTDRFIPIGVWSVRNNGPGTNFGQYITFPDETSPTSAAAYTGTWLSLFSLGDHYIVGIVGHQNRILAIAAPSDSSYGFGPDAQLIGGEEIWYNGFDTDNKPDTQSAFVGPVIVSEGEYSGYGAWASLNANELLLIRHRGGGALIRGDIANPSVVRIPGLPGVHGRTNIPAVTPSGVAYGTRSGFYLWSGSDQATHLSPQLANDFWISRTGWTGADFGPEVEQPTAFGVAIVGRSTYQAPFLYAPNNYLCDLDSERKSWWRLTAQGQPAIHHWDTGTLGVWGFHEYVNAAKTLTRAATHFDPEQPTNLYYYESLPITPSRARYVTVREILVTVSGQIGDQVVVRVTGVEGTGGNAYDERTITLAASGTEDHRLDLDVTGTNVQVSVTATAAGASTNPAPRVHKLSYGYLPAAKINA